MIAATNRARSRAEESANSVSRGLGLAAVLWYAA